jgi:hypothetical protein
MMDVITCGEMLVDCVSTEAGVSLAQALAFKKPLVVPRRTLQSARLD